MVFKVSVIRPDDLLNLQIEGRNLQIETSLCETPVLIPEDTTQIAYLIVHFPPQTIAEEAVYESRQDLEINPPPTSTNDPKDPEKLRREIRLPENVFDPPVRSRIGQPSRLVFQLPANTNPRIPYTIEGLLNWTGLELNVSQIAAIRATPTAEERGKAPAISPPTELETAIEIPYRLILSPNSDVIWQHAVHTVTHAGRTELWHTRLTHSGKESGNEQKNETQQSLELSRVNPALLRAIWSPDYVSQPSNPETTLPWPILGKLDEWAGRPVLTAMNARDRHEIVILTSAFWGFVKSRTDWATYEPQSIQAEQVMLSALGGWLKSRGNWKPPTEWILIRPSPNPNLTESSTLASFNTMPEALSQAPSLPNLTTLLDPTLLNFPFPLPPLQLGDFGTDLNISEWVHVATQGRDHYVQIVYEGYLYPFGHQAALIKVTERKFREVNGAPFAYLVQRMFIVVRQILKDYTLENDDQEALPYNGFAMPLKQVRLTTLVTPDIDPPSLLNGTDYSFWVRVGSQDFKFHAVGQDVQNQHQVDFTTALIFVPGSDAAISDRVNTIRELYNQSGDRRACEVPGQALTYAEPNGDSSDNTTLTTQKLYFDTDSEAKAKFIPKLDKAVVNLATVEQLLDTKAPVEIKYYKPYIDAGKFDEGNEVFAELLTKFPSRFSADKAGGIATPDLSIKGLTRKLGAIAGDLAKAATDNFDPQDFFSDLAETAKLFGKLKLTELIATGSFSNAPNIEFFPETTPPSVRLDWQPDILDWPPEGTPVSFFQFKKEHDSILSIQGTVEQPVDGNAGRSLFTGNLTNFYLEFFNIVKLSFDAFRFSSVTGRKTDVNVQLKGDNALEFLGDLKFVNELKKIIPPGLFGDGSSLELTPQPGIRAGFSIGLPPVEVGVFALKDVALGASLTLPFLNGSPLFDFNISERQRPFNLTIAFFGGGGFFRLQLDTLAVRIIEAAFEFGASASINLGVASGGVYIMAGIYFKLETKPDGNKKATLTGFFRMGGNLTVLGIISVSLEFNLSFTYEAVGKATGRATLTVKIKILFFSKSVEISVEKTFGGGEGDPMFAQVWDVPEIWNEYAGAFA
ncbi:hypothetical protein H6G96_37625 [Nostoc sp. FACHB-892]|uniref:hypothetical protein n=1 Tax=Nostoc sp. FACHB-892 TaxID=2692843 RepID=UPI0016895A9F|nr:hypothetical protein [Nostoc sp. FACHB-892]MBD2731844.1 hypothetical protein [Nostoc sp. FACHB-892]